MPCVTKQWTQAVQRAGRGLHHRKTKRFNFAHIFGKLKQDTNTVLSDTN